MRAFEPRDTIGTDSEFRRLARWGEELTVLSPAVTCLHGPRRHPDTPSRLPLRLRLTGRPILRLLRDAEGERPQGTAGEPSGCPPRTAQKAGLQNAVTPVPGVRVMAAGGRPEVWMVLCPMTVGEGLSPRGSGAPRPARLPAWLLPGTGPEVGVRAGSSRALPAEVGGERARPDQGQAEAPRGPWSLQGAETELLLLTSQSRVGQGL